MRSVSGLKSKVDILPLNPEFEVKAPQDYESVEKGEGRRVMGKSVEIEIGAGQSFTVVLRMRGGMDRRFLKAFNFG